MRSGEGLTTTFESFSGFGWVASIIPIQQHFGAQLGFVDPGFTRGKPHFSLIWVGTGLAKVWGVKTLGFSVFS